MNAAAANPLPILLPPSHFEMLGGHAGVMRLVDAFYRHMDNTGPNPSPISTTSKESS